MTTLEINGKMYANDNISSTLSSSIGSVYDDMHAMGGMIEKSFVDAINGFRDAIQKTLSGQVSSNFDKISYRLSNKHNEVETYDVDTYSVIPVHRNKCKYSTIKRQFNHIQHKRWK